MEKRDITENITKMPLFRITTRKASPEKTAGFSTHVENQGKKKYRYSFSTTPLLDLRKIID